MVDPASLAPDARFAAKPIASAAGPPPGKNERAVRTAFFAPAFRASF